MITPEQARRQAFDNIREDLLKFKKVTMTKRRTDRTLAEKKAVQARRASNRAAKRAARSVATLKLLTDSQKLDRLRKSRRQSEKALARRPLRSRAARRSMQKAIAKAQRILQKE